MTVASFLSWYTLQQGFAFQKRNMNHDKSCHQQRVLRCKMQSAGCSRCCKAPSTAEHTCSLRQSGCKCPEGSRPAGLQVGQQAEDDGEGGGGEEARGVRCLDQGPMGPQHCVVLYHCHPGSHQLPTHQYASHL